MPIPCSRRAPFHAIGATLIVLACAYATAGSAASAAVCEGKYDAAAGMVDGVVAKYGTLYSGGGHKHSLDHVGASVDLYRLWRGLPDVKLRAAYGPDLPFGWNSHAVTQPELRAALRLGTQAEPDGETPEDTFKALIRLDLATVDGHPGDWWIALAGADADMPPARRQIVEAAAVSPFLDWLQYALAASSRSWAHGWHLWQPVDEADASGYARLSARAMDRYTGGSGLEWLVAASLFPANDTAFIQSEMRRFATAIANCDANPAEYAAFAAIAAFRAGDAIEVTWKALASLSPVVRQHVFEQEVLLASWRGDRGWGREWFDGASGYAAAADRLGMPATVRAWAAVFDTYTAGSAQEVIDLHAGHPWMPKAVRALNLLPLDALAAYATTAGLSDEQRDALLRVASARAFALGNLELGHRLAMRLAEHDPAVKERIDAIDSLDVPSEVALALLVIFDPRMSAWLGSNSASGGAEVIALDDADWALQLRHSLPRRDLLPEIARGDAIADDLETWWRMPQRWGRYHSMRGYTIKAIDRAAYSRSRYRLGPMYAPTSIALSGLRSWAAWEEAARLTGSARLSTRLAETLLTCAEHPPASWFRRSGCRDEIMAEALHRLVLLAPREIGGELGRRQGKRAFELLHRAFPDSEWTGRTPYWFAGR